MEGDGRVVFKPNAHYRTGGIEVRGPRPYERFGIEKGKPIYRQFAEDPNRSCSFLDLRWRLICGALRAMMGYGRGVLEQGVPRI